MTEPRPDEAVHQVFFGWSQDSGKLDLLSYSFQERRDAESWLRRLEAHLRLQPAPGADLPPDALSYIDFDDGNVAVLRRVNLGHSRGRNNSHALIGSVTHIDVRVALGLYHWAEWKNNAPGGQRLHVLPAPYIADQAVRAAALRSWAGQIETQLTNVLTRILDQPTRPLSIIGCPNEYRLAVVWGLSAAADKHLRDSGCPRRWSFSTYEVRHDDSIRWLPEIVFLPAKPVGAGVANRTIVEFAAETPMSRNHDVAEQLVAALLHGAEAPQPKPVLETVGATFGGGVSFPVPATQPRFEQHLGGYEATHQSAERQLIGALLQATSVRDFESTLGELEKSAQWQENRRLMRTMLDGAALDSATRFVEYQAKREWLERLLKVAYGPKLEDLSDSDGLEHASKMINQSQSELLVMRLGRAAARRPSAPIRDAAWDRTSVGARPAPPAPAAQPDRRPRTSRNHYLAYFVAAILLLTLVFVLGYLAGQPSPATPSTAPPPGAGAPTSSAAQPAPPNPLTPFTAVAATPIERQYRVFGFIQAGADFYPQEFCTSGDQRNWTCAVRFEPPGKTGVDRKRVAYRVAAGDEAELTAADPRKPYDKVSPDWVPLLPPIK